MTRQTSITQSRDFISGNDRANRSIEVGLRWVESIPDKKLRRAAREYLSGASWLTVEERSDVARHLDAEIRT